MTVDLNRLREAADGWDPDEAQHVARAVLDARQIWWCEKHEKPEQRDADMDGYVSCPDGVWIKHRGYNCEMVPGAWVKGGQDAS